MTVQEVLDSLTLEELKIITKSVLEVHVLVSKINITPDMTTEEINEASKPLKQQIMQTPLPDELLEKLNKLT
jgi:hypothetical protein